MRYGVMRGYIYTMTAGHGLRARLVIEDNRFLLAAD